MKKRIVSMVLAAFACSALSLEVDAQQDWVDFADDRTRLQFDTDDDQEKDIVVGDLDNDGDEDVVVVRKRPFSVDGERVNLLLMNENGNLVDRTLDFVPTFVTDPDNARDVLLIEVNNDGWPDLIVANTFGSLPRLYINLGEDKNGDWIGFEDQGSNGQWYSPQFPTTPQACAVAVGDVNGDGFDDIYFPDYSNNLEARLFINNQDNTFSDETLSRMSSAARNQSFGTAAFFADMNGNGHLDIVSNDSVAFGGVGVEIAFNDGNGNFFQTQVLPSNTSYMVMDADFNNDGRIDIYVVDDGQDYVLFNNSTNNDGTINASLVSNTQSSLTSGFNGNILPADVDNDGWIDVAVSDVDVDIPGCERRFTLLRNNNGTNLRNPNNGTLMAWNMEGSHDTAWIDINQDGNLDMFMATCDDYHMFINQAEPAVVLGDINGDGSVNLLDVTPFIDLITSNEFQAAGDINMDGTVDLLDVAGFVDLLSGG